MMLKSNTGLVLENDTTEVKLYASKKLIEH